MGKHIQGRHTGDFCTCQSVRLYWHFQKRQSTQCANTVAIIWPYGSNTSLQIYRYIH